MKQVVSKEEATASAEAGKVKAIKDECEGDLAEAMPLLEVSTLRGDESPGLQPSASRGLVTPSLPPSC